MLLNVTHLLRTTVIVSAVLTLTQMGVTAQEITYNLTPTHELGAELWQIPISGKLTMSADGKRVLVACLADSAFYMVDVETGAYRKLKARYYQDNTYGKTHYTTDAQLRFMAQTNTKSIRLNIWDLEADSVVVWKDLGFKSLSAISYKQDRVIHKAVVYKASTLEAVDTLSEAVTAWYDDDRSNVYYLYGSTRQVQEVNVATNQILRSWTVRPVSAGILRPSMSDWLYIVAIETDGLPGGSQNFVEAINLTTGERLTFTKYFWSGVDGHPDFTYSYAYFLPTSNTCHARGSDGGHLNVVWEFDADEQSTRCLVDLSFLFFDSAEKRSLIIHPSKSFLLSCWNSPVKDSSILRCNALVPAATSTPDEASASSSNNVIVIQRDNILTIEFAGTSVGEVVQEVQVFSSDGHTVITQPVTDPAVPVTLAIGHLSSGAYRLMVRTTQRQLFSSFTIVR